MNIFNMKGPGDFLPPEHEDLPECFIEEAIEALDDMIVDKAWALYEAAKQQAAVDCGEALAEAREFQDV